MRKQEKRREGHFLIPVRGSRNLSPKSLATFLLLLLLLLPLPLLPFSLLRKPHILAKLWNGFSSGSKGRNVVLPRFSLLLRAIFFSQRSCPPASSTFHPHIRHCFGFVTLFARALVYLSRVTRSLATTVSPFLPFFAVFPIIPFSLPSSDCSWQRRNCICFPGNWTSLNIVCISRTKPFNIIAPTLIFEEGHCSEFS